MTTTESTAPEDITYRQYRDEVRSYAGSILDEVEAHADAPLDSHRFDDELSEFVLESVDGHSWVLYYGYNLAILQHADNEPEEWMTYVDPDETFYRRVLNAMAYTAFRADVFDEVNRQLSQRIDDAEEAAA